MDDHDGRYAFGLPSRDRDPGSVRRPRGRVADMHVTRDAASDEDSLVGAVAVRNGEVCVASIRDLGAVGRPGRGRVLGVRPVAVAGEFLEVPGRLPVEVYDRESGALGARRYAVAE